MRLLPRKGIRLGPPPARNRRDHPYVGTADFRGIPIRVETAKGETRRGADPDGTPWSIRFEHHYGEVVGSEGLDGEPVDCYLGPDETSTMAYVVHQKHPGTQAVDEDKVMLGFASSAEAERAYRDHYSSGGFYAGITSWPVDELRLYLADRSNLGKRLDRPKWVRERMTRREGSRAVMRKAVAQVKAHQSRSATGAVENVKAHQRIVKPSDVKPGAHFPMPPPEYGQVHHGDVHVNEVKDGKASVSWHKPGGYGRSFPVEHVPNIVHDVRGTLDHHTPTSGNEHVDAAIKGGKFLGKGNDGLAFRTPSGKHVVKASTTVPFHPHAGLRTPQQAMEHTDTEAEAHTAHAADPLVQKIEHVHHEGRSWLVKPHLSPAGKLSRPELDKVRDSIQGMHERGWSLNDQIQLGRDDAGNLKHMDLGSSSKGASHHDREGDEHQLDTLYREHGEAYTPGGAALQQKLDDLHPKFMGALERAEKRGRTDPILQLTHERLMRLRDSKALELLLDGESRMDDGVDMDTAMGAWEAHYAEDDALQKRMAALPDPNPRPLRKAQMGMFGGPTQEVQIQGHMRRTKSGKAVAVTAHTDHRRMAQQKPRQRQLLTQRVHKEDDPRPTSVELFAGAGGLTYGLHRAGFRGLAQVEMNPNACKTLRTMQRKGAIEGDVIEADANTVDFHQWKGADLVAGGPPCQPFSSAGKRLGPDDLRDGWPIFLRAVEEIQPKHVLAENVKNLLSGEFEEYRDAIVGKLNALGYEAEWKLVNAADYGVPQLRERVFLTAWKKGAKPFRAPEPSHHDPRKGANVDQLPMHHTALDVADDEGHEYWDAKEIQATAPTAQREEWLEKHRPIRLVRTTESQDQGEYGGRPVRSGDVPLTVTTRHSSGGVHLIEVPDFEPGARVRAFDDPDDGPRGWDDEDDLFSDDFDPDGPYDHDPDFDLDEDDPDRQIAAAERGEAKGGWGKTWGRGWIEGTVVYNNGDSIDVDWDDGDVEPWDRTMLVAQEHTVKRAPREFRAAWQGFPQSWDWQGSNEAVDKQIGNAVPPLLAEHFGRAITKAPGRPDYRATRHAKFEKPARKGLRLGIIRRAFARLAKGSPRQPGLFRQVEVKAHPRRSKTGAVAVVRQHERRVAPAAHPQLALFPPGRPHTDDWAGVIDFASGSNHAGEIRGLHEAKHAIGLAAPEVNAASERELHALAGTGHPVFLDSGAFSEVTFNFPDKKGKLPKADLPPGIHVTKPITDAQWEKRLDLYERLARSLGRQLYVVAPDKVGDQQGTLDRLDRYKDRIRRIEQFGAHVLAPIQKGSTPMAVFDQQVEAILGHSNYVRAIPMKKDATTLAELVDFLRARQPKRVHLLGLGSTNAEAETVLHATRAAVPGIRVTMDSNKIVAKAGRSGGLGDAEYPDPKDKRRALTVQTDRAREDLAQSAYLGDNQPIMHQGLDDAPIGLDYTDQIGEPSGWLTTVEGNKVAASAGLDEEATAAFLDDPDGFLQEEASNGSPWYADQGMSEALDEAWGRYVAKHTVAEKKRRASRIVFDKTEAPT